MAKLRVVVRGEAFVVQRGGPDSFTLTKRWRMTLDCGHTVTRDTAVARAKCPRGCELVQSADDAPKETT